MKHKAYVVKDEKASAFAHPFFTETNGMAIRQFLDWCKNDNTPLSKHPEDYTLWKIGEYDDETARLSSDDTPTRLADGNEILSAAEPIRNLSATRRVS